MNVDTKYKIYLSAVIWLTFLLAFMVGIGLLGLNFGGFAILLAMAAMAVSGFLWQGTPDGHDGVSTVQQAAKAKNSDRINEILGHLTHDEMDALRKRLRDDVQDEEVEMILTDDGELEERYAR